MKRTILLLVGVALGVLMIMHLQQRPGKRVPFYLANIEALRQLPLEDLLRMRDDILREAAKQPDRPVREESPSGGEAVAEGVLQAPAHGEVRILRLPGNRSVARLEDFRINNAPDLELYLSSQRREGFDASTAIRLGPIKGNTGSQNFEIPAGADPAELHTAAIWCSLFRMSFGTAELAAQGAGARSGH